MAKIAIVGTGLIGTSLALGLRESDLRNLELSGTDYDGRARSGAQKRGAFHKVEGRLAPAVEGADVVVLATPVMAMRDIMESIAPQLKEDAVVTDVGSSKRLVAQWGGGVAARWGAVCGGASDGGAGDGGAGTRRCAAVCGEGVLRGA